MQHSSNSLQLLLDGDLLMLDHYLQVASERELYLKKE